MTLDQGTPAPAFQVEDVWGQPIALADYAGKALLLSFFRNSACALCNLRVHQLIQRYPAYHRRGLETLVVFESSRGGVLEHVGRQDAPFPIVADPRAQLYTLYQVEISEPKIARTLAMTETQEHIQAAAAAGFPLIQEPGSNFNRIPADFLIGPDLTIQRAHYAQYLTDHLPFDVIEQFLEEQTVMSARDKPISLIV